MLRKSSESSDEERLKVLTNQTFAPNPSISRDRRAANKSAMSTKPTYNPNGSDFGLTFASLWIFDRERGESCLRRRAAWGCERNSSDD